MSQLRGLGLRVRLKVLSKYAFCMVAACLGQRLQGDVIRRAQYPMRLGVSTSRVLLLYLFVSGSGLALGSEILGTNVGVVTTDAGAVQVPRRYKYIGQVIVKFGLDETGNVTDPFVVASEPPGVFERAALSHVKTYKYQPPTLESGAVTHIDEIAIKLVFDPNRR
jgi:TonB family protein